MKLPESPFTAIDWSKVPETIHHGETGQASWKTFQSGDLRIRRVTYSPGYLADHWCAKGHVIHILEGSMVSELKDGTQTPITAGMTYFMGDDADNPHRSYTKQGVVLFIVD